MSFLVLIYLSIVAGFEPASAVDTNQTIECAIRETRLCFNNIQSLGGNPNVTYAEKDVDLNRTCASLNVINPSFPNCLEDVPTKCVIRNPNLSLIKSIEDFVGKICTNGTVEQKNFLNASKDCFNKYEAQRKKCVTQHATNKTDAESLCCQSYRTQTCVKKDLRNLCSKNSTDFQEQMINTYNSYTNFICKSYEKICNGASVNFLSIASLLLTAKVILFNIFNV